MASNPGKLLHTVSPAALVRGDPEHRFRAELALAFGLFVMLVFLQIAVTELAWGTALMGWIFAVSLVPAIAVLLWLWHGGRATTAGRVLLIMLFGLATIANIGSGGRALGATLAMPTIALFAVLMSSRRAGVAWVVLILIEIAATAFLRRSNFDFPIRPDPEWVATAIDRVPLFFSIASAVIGLLILRSLDQYRFTLREAREVASTAQAAAARAARRFADFADIAADGFWETDASLRLTYVSPSFAQLMGVDAVGILGLTPEQAYLLRFPDAPDLPPYSEPMSKRVAFRDQLLLAEDAAGVRRWLLNQGQPHIDDDGVFTGYRGAVRDVSEQRRSESALKASERRLRLVTENIPAIVTYLDSEQCYRYANAMAGRVLGRSTESMLGCSLMEIHGPDRHAVLLPHVSKVLGGEGVSFESEATMGGIHYHLESTYVPETAANGHVQGFYAMTFDISRLKRIESELRELSQFDSLTGLASRRRLNERLAEALARSERNGQLVAVMFLDLDHFKDINDSLGHAGGDAVLREVARRISTGVRRVDTVARLAGDEFVIVLEELRSPDMATLVAQKVLDAMSVAFEVEGTIRQVSASIGVALRRAGELDGEAILRRADEALYAAKAAGRGRFSMAP